MQQCKGTGLPPSVLIIGRTGVCITVVAPGEVVELRPLVIARDLGHVVELSEPLDQTLRIVSSAPEGLASGDRVRIVAPRAAPSGKT